jgi:hypothetical protein
MNSSVVPRDPPQLYHGFRCIDSDSSLLAGRLPTLRRPGEHPPWDRYLCGVYGAIPPQAYPIDLSSFEFFYQRWLPITVKPARLDPACSPRYNHAWIGQNSHVPESSLMGTGFFVQKVDVDRQNGGNEATPTGHPHHAKVEVMRVAVAHKDELIGTWYWSARGSGIWLDVGRTLVVHADKNVSPMAVISRAAQHAALDTLQFPRSAPWAGFNMTNQRYEIVALRPGITRSTQSPTGHPRPKLCHMNYTSGWEQAARPCPCQEEEEVAPHHAHDLPHDSKRTLNCGRLQWAESSCGDGGAATEMHANRQRWALAKEVVRAAMSRSGSSSSSSSGSGSDNGGGNGNESSTLDAADDLPPPASFMARFYGSAETIPERVRTPFGPDGQGILLCHANIGDVHVLFIHVWKVNTQGVCANLLKLQGLFPASSAAAGTRNLTISFVREPIGHFVSGFSEAAGRSQGQERAYARLNATRCPFAFRPSAPPTAQAQDFLADTLAGHIANDSCKPKGSDDLHAFPQLAFIRQAAITHGVGRVDFLGRLEHFDADWQALGLRLGLSTHDRPLPYDPHAMLAWSRSPPYVPHLAQGNAHPRTDVNSNFAPRRAMAELLSASPERQLALCLLLLPDYACLGYPLPNACINTSGLPESLSARVAATLRSTSEIDCGSIASIRPAATASTVPPAVGDGAGSDAGSPAASADGDAATSLPAERVLAKSAGARVAVCVAGAVRTFTNPKVSSSVAAHVLDVLRASPGVESVTAFLHLKREDASGNPRIPNRVVPPSTHAEILSAAALLQPAVVELGDELSHMRPRLRCPIKFNKTALPSSVEAALNQVWMNQQCVSLIERYEAALPATRRFTHCVRVRPDLLWAQNVSSPEHWPPEGARWHDWAFMLPRHLLEPILGRPYRMLEECTEKEAQTFSLGAALWVFRLMEAAQLQAHPTTTPGSVMRYFQDSISHRSPGQRNGMPKLGAADTLSYEEARTFFPVSIARDASTGARLPRCQKSIPPTLIPRECRID